MEDQQKNLLPLLPLRDVVVFPHMVIPLFVGRNESIKALEAAMTQDKQIFLVAQKDPAIDTPTAADLYSMGTIATVLQLLHLPDGTVKVLVEGLQRAKIVEVKSETDFMSAAVEPITDSGSVEDTEIVVLMRDSQSV